jgi:hypothetical protein
MLAASPGRAQEPPSLADPQSAQAATQRKIDMEKAMQAADEMKRVELQRVLQATQQGLDKFNIEFKVASSGMLGPVVTGAPYTATTTNESIQTLVDGNRIVRRSTYNIARDAQGRVRREEVNEAGTVVSVMIMDPITNTSYVLDPVSRTARKTTLLRGAGFVRTDSTAFLTEGTVDRNGSVTVRGVQPAARAESAAVAELKARVGGNVVYGESTYVTVSPASGTMQFRREALGTQDLEGVSTEGTRTVSTIPAGQIGNERPIDLVSEQWYSKDLQMTVMSRHSDPRNGETTYRVSNLRQGQPDASLFQVPGDYTMTESPSGAVRKIVK